MSIRSADRDALALGEADVIAPFLVEIRKKLLFRLSFDVQAEDVARLDCLEVFAALFGAEAEALEHGRKGGVARRNVGVDLDDVGFVFLCQRLRAVQKLRKCLAVVKVAHRTAAAIHESSANTGDLARHDGKASADSAVFAAHGDGVPLPHGLLLAPEIALGEVSLGVGLDKGFVFRKRFFGNEFVHAVRSTSIYCITRAVSRKKAKMVSNILPYLCRICKCCRIVFPAWRHNNSQEVRCDGRRTGAYGAV